MKKQFDWKKWIPNVVILLIFALASVIYFQPALEGKIIASSDGIHGRAATEECIAYHEQTGDYSYWSGSMFSGMPNYQIGGNGGYQIDKIMRPVRWFFAWGNRNTIFIFLFYLCAFWLLLRSFKVDKWLSMAGAFAIAMSSYFFVIIAASHHGKCYSITWMTLVVIGFILTYRKQYGWGALLVMFFTYIGFFLHPQMSYYICMMIGIFFFAELAIAIRNKEWKHLAIASAVFFCSFAIGMCMGSANIFANQEYAAETMRGGHSDLEKITDGENKTKGLDLDYATAWSEGIDESLTFLVPNYMGGCSGYNLGEGSQLEKDLKKLGVPGRQAKAFCQGAPTYWGDKAFTSGPVYMGAVVIFLFLLGLLIVDGPYKWALLVATLFSLTLSWGHNFMWLTELFFKYFPMYNKFRAVESILIVAEITVPVLGMLALKAIHDGDLEWKRVRNSIGIAGGLTALTCLIIAWMSGSIDVTSSYDAAWKGQVGDQIYSLILDQRRTLIAEDAHRSLIFVLLGTAVVFAFAYARYNKEVKNLTMYAGMALTVLIVADMWPVDKRFCNDSFFQTHKGVYNNFNKLPYEEHLLQSDPSYYRVMNLTTNTFNEARTSYYLKSIGGYSAAKLRRYQDLIDEHISKMHMPVISMLNTKYIISKGQDGQPFPYLNPDAMGNCWLVDELVAVDNANAESDALMTIDLKKQAVYDQSYAPNAHISDRPEMQTLMAFDEEKIEMVGEYAPNKLCYRSQAEHAKTAVFSEIYYPYGWKCTIDGAPAEIYRVNYMLRAVTVPAGIHDIVFSFEPESVHKGNMLSLVGLALFLLTLIGVCGYEVYRRKKGNKENEVTL